MVTIESINRFLNGKKIAVAGVSRKKHKFGNVIYKNLIEKKYTVYPINPSLKEIDGKECFSDLKSLPEKVDGLVIVTKPEVTGQLINEAHAAGIKNIWIQQGADSDEAIQSAKSYGMNIVYGQCLIMFLDQPGFIHNAHKWIKKVTHTLPH